MSQFNSDSVFGNDYPEIQVPVWLKPTMYEVRCMHEAIKRLVGRKPVYTKFSNLCTLIFKRMHVHKLSKSSMYLFD